MKMVQEENNSVCYLKCKECKNKITENIKESDLQKISLKDKEYFAVKITDIRYYLLAGKNKLLKMSKNSILYDEILCITCKSKYGIQIKSSRDEMESLLNNYLLINVKQACL